MADEDTLLTQEPGGNAETNDGDATLLTGADGADGKDKETPGKANEGEDKGGQGDGKEKAPADPEPYELAAPENYPLGEAGLQGLNDLCKSARLSKEQGEAVMQYMAGNYTAFQARQMRLRKDWIGEFKADKDFGGDKFDASLADAKKALDLFDPHREVHAKLRETGYGDNPHVLRIFARVGRALAEDSPVSGAGGAGGLGGRRPLEERFYPNM